MPNIFCMCVRVCVSAHIYHMFRSNMRQLQLQRKFKRLSACERHNELATKIPRIYVYACACMCVCLSPMLLHYVCVCMYTRRAVC